MAGKKRDGGSVKVTLTDGGSLKDLDKKAKKTGKSMGSVAKNVNESDRRLKSLSQQTSNSTKAFSKQAQTIGGGLVPIYATIAAQVFAVSAAFRFLQDAMQTRNMIEGQKAFGAVTGTAYAALTASIQTATANMLSFQEAASAAAIGTAAGLTRSQMEGLGQAAKNASLALGRDLTDSFNRLVRGVTKAEPELLDELGIILRLEPATEKYAQMIGKTRQELNAFERSQAVANEVLDQAERKFGAIQKIMDEDAFALGQFAKEFDDLMKMIKEKVANILIPVVQFLKENIMSLVGVMGLLAAPIVKSILPDFSAFAAGAQATADSSRKMAKALKADADLLKQVKQGGEIGTDARKAFSQRGREGMQGMLSGMDMSGQSKTMQKAAMGKKLNAQELGVLKRHLKQKGHMLEGFTKQEQARFTRYIRHQELALKGSLSKAKLEYKQLGIVGSQAFNRIGAAASTAYAAAARGAAVATKYATKLMGAFGWISLAIIAFQALKDFFGQKEEVTKYQKELQELTKTMGKLNEELDKMNQVRRLGLLTDSIEIVKQQANALQSADLPKLMADYSEALVSGASPEQLKVFEETARAVEKLNPELAGLGDAMSGGFLSDTQIRSFSELSNEILGVGMALQQMSEQMQGVQKAFTSMVSGVKSSRFTPAMTAIGTALNTDTGYLGDKAFAKRKATLAINDAAIAEKTKFNALGAQAGGIVTSLTDAGFGGKGKSGKFLSRDSEEIKNIIELASTQQGLDLINGQLGTNFTSEEQVETYLTAKDKRGGYQGQTANNKFGARRTDAAMSIFAKLRDSGFSNPGQIDQRGKELGEMKAARKASFDAIESDEKDATKLAGLQKKMNKFLDEENRIRKSMAETQKERIQNTLNVNAADKAHQEFKMELDTKADKLATALNEQAAAQLIVDQDLAKVVGEKKEDLERNLEIAKENVALAQEELRIAKEKSLLDGRALEFQIARGSGMIGQGSFFNSFANRQNEFVMGKEQQIKDYAAGETIGMEEGPDKEARVNELILQRTKYYQDQYLQLEKINSSMKFQQQMATRLTEGLANDMAGALVSVAQGTKTVKEAFGQMAISILADITKMIIKQLILNALMAMVGMINPGAAAGLGKLMGMTSTPVRQGGIMSPGAGGGYRSYRAGGIADGPEKGYPATLHGTEAVVPLGNDREIPVKMLEGGNGTNNVSITVNMQDGGATQDIKTEGEKAKAFGASISAAVQQEIVKQQRAGGLLNSY